MHKPNEEVTSSGLRTPMRLSAHLSRGLTFDLQKRIDDVYSEMERKSNEGVAIIPAKFINFHKTDTMFLFLHAAVLYAFAFIQVKGFQRDLEDPKDSPASSVPTSAYGSTGTTATPAALTGVRGPNTSTGTSTIVTTSSHGLPSTSNNQTQCNDANSATTSGANNLQSALEAQSQSALALASSYSRLILHCSNFERHKEDEHFFECVYFFLCAVVKLCVAPEHWECVEEEFGFVFRGSQFSSSIRRHVAFVHEANAAQCALSTRKRQNLVVATATTASDKETAAAAKKKQNAADAFELPAQRYCYFHAAMPINQIASSIDANRERTSKNLQLSKTLRDRITCHRSQEYRRQLEAIVSPRHHIRLDYDLAAGSSSPKSRIHGEPDCHRDVSSRGGTGKTDSTPTSHVGGASGDSNAGISAASTIESTKVKTKTSGNGGNEDVANALLCKPSPPLRSASLALSTRLKSLTSPRLSMRNTLTARSPVVNHLLPSHEDRVRDLLVPHEQALQTFKATTSPKKAVDDGS